MTLENKLKSLTSHNKWRSQSIVNLSQQKICVNCQSQISVECRSQLSQLLILTKNRV